MPKNKIINARPLDDTLQRKTLFVSQEAVEAINNIGRVLMVSQGSLVDTALKVLALMPLSEIVEELFKHNHLTQQEYNYIQKLLAQESQEDDIEETK